MIKLACRTCISFALVLFSLLVGISCQPVETKPAEQLSIAAKPAYENIAESLKELITTEIEKAGINGLSIALVDDQKVVWAEGFGFSDKNAGKRASIGTVYRVGSISKLFTDIGIMQLVEQGKIDLDAPITDYFPEFELDDPFPDDDPVSLRRLMSHTSGIPRECRVGHYFDGNEPTIEETVMSLIGMRHVYPVGTRTKYSNSGITIVGYDDTWGGEDEGYE